MNQQILQRLDVLADKLGVEAEKLWELAVRYSYLNSLIAFCTLISFAIVGIAACCVLIRRGDRTYDSINIPIGVIAGAIGLVSLVGSLVCLPDLLMPEAAAFRWISEKLAGMR